MAGDDEEGMKEDQLAYVQTCKALEQAKIEQDALRERLTALEVQNKPGRLDQPVMVSTMGPSGGSQQTGDDLVAELEAMHRLLDNTGRATDNARADLEQVVTELREFRRTSADEARELLETNAKRNRVEMRREEDSLAGRLDSWGEEKMQLMGELERLSRANFEALQEAADAQKHVKEQTEMMDDLAQQLSREVEKTRELRVRLHDTREKVASTETLQRETQENETRIAGVEHAIAAQKRLSKARRMSMKAQAKFDELGEAIRVAEGQRKAAEDELALRQRALDEAIAAEREAERSLAQARAEYVEEQTAARVADAELRELTSAIERLKQSAVAEGRRNMALQAEVRQKKLAETVHFVARNARAIVKPERVQATLTTLGSGTALPQVARKYASPSRRGNQPPH